MASLAPIRLWLGLIGMLSDGLCPWQGGMGKIPEALSAALLPPRVRCV
jgi:hypothetical protein